MRAVPTRYECEICERVYDKEKDAIECESQGVQELLPVGLIYGNAKGFYKDITLCIAKSERNGHYLDNSLWACRDNGAGDNLGEELCGDSFGYSTQNEVRESPNRAHPTFRRMIKYLKKNKIKPLMVQRGKLVTAK